MKIIRQKFSAKSLEDLGMNEEWRKRQIILPEELVTQLFGWHGGQDSYLVLARVYRYAEPC